MIPSLPRIVSNVRARTFEAKTPATQTRDIQKAQHILQLLYITLRNFNVYIPRDVDRCYNDAMGDDVQRDAAQRLAKYAFIFATHRRLRTLHSNEQTRRRRLQGNGVHEDEEMEDAENEDEDERLMMEKVGALSDEYNLLVAGLRNGDAEVEGPPDETCSVCLETYNSHTRVPVDLVHCRHRLCAPSFFTWYQTFQTDPEVRIFSCPQCRHPITDAVFGPLVQEDVRIEDVVQGPIVQVPLADVVQDPIVQVPLADVVQDHIVQDPACQDPIVQVPIADVVQGPIVQDPACQDPIVQVPAIQGPIVQVQVPVLLPVCGAQRVTEAMETVTFQAFQTILTSMVQRTIENRRSSI